VILNAVPGDGDAWLRYLSPGGTEYVDIDLRTGLGWAVVRGPFPTYVEMERQCSDLTWGGISNWRLPTIDETRALGAGCSTTSPGGTCPLSGTCLDRSCGGGAACDSCPVNMGPRMPPDLGYYYRPDVTVWDRFVTSSRCADCPTESYWFYYARDASFRRAEATDLGLADERAVCVTVDPPRPLVPPCLNP
jgi:hypothetical protein